MDVDPIILLNDDLRNLRPLFQEAGFDIRLVGGCVRDLIYGKTPKDIDLCTDANPDEQIAIYQKHDIRYIETGLKHGTISVLMNDIIYEITSLRTDVETDGRHAVVAYTRDWISDLRRRDFTINAMNLDFDGNLLDPFGGKKDLTEGKVKFVGDPYVRIKEDYLRILRWFRFRGRFNHENVDPDDEFAVYSSAGGLQKISKERIWAELKQIIIGDNARYLLKDMIGKDILMNCGIPSYYIPRYIDVDNLNEVHSQTKNPITCLTSYFSFRTSEILRLLKASNEEINLAKLLSDNDQLNPFKMMAISNISREYAIEVAILQRRDPFEIAVLHEWEVPSFPVNGFDLMKLGMKPGPQYGLMLEFLKEKWADSNYILDKEDLLKEANKFL